MKISKLFHWLYALLMLLPAFAIGVTCAYVIFNKNAYQSYYGENINDKEYITIESYDDFKINNEYRFTLLTNTTTSNRQAKIYFEDLEVIETNIQNIVDFESYNYFSIDYADSRIYINFYGNNVPTTTYNSIQHTLIFDFTLINYASGNNQAFVDTYDHMIQKIEYNKYSFLSSAFYYAVNEVEESPLFNWAYDSFLASPITYITGLFGMPNDSIVILLLSYWLDISIIYLVFDLIMYVPLLVHRWLDKGVLE